MSPDYCIVLVTAKDKAQAKRIATALLKEKLAACVNIVPGVESMFWWEGKIDRAKEVLLMIKTSKLLFQKIEACVRLHHSYQNPEIIVLPITQGSKAYLNWIKESL